MVGIFLSVYSM